MKNRPQLQVSTKTSVSTRVLITYCSGALVLIAAIFGLITTNRGSRAPTSPMKEYYFSPIDDNFYENPSNWIPEYPGTKIESGSKIVIQGLAYITSFDLEILGEIHVPIDGMLFSSEGNLKVLKGGKILNEGELVVNSIDNEGELHNQMSASINVHDYTAHANAFTHNLQGASMMINKRLLNQGSFNNYGQCNVRLDFDNQAEFNQIRGGELLVKGTQVDIQTAAGS